VIQRPKIYAVDFDGTIVRDAFPEIGELYPQAVWALRMLHKFGNLISIWSCRCNHYQEDMEIFLEFNKVPFDYVNRNTDGQIDHWTWDCRKIFADVYIDDRNYPRFHRWMWYVIVFQAWLDTINWPAFKVHTLWIGSEHHGLYRSIVRLIPRIGRSRKAIPVHEDSRTNRCYKS